MRGPRGGGSAGPKLVRGGGMRGPRGGGRGTRVRPDGGGPVGWRGGGGEGGGGGGECGRSRVAEEDGVDHLVIGDAVGVLKGEGLGRERRQ